MRMLLIGRGKMGTLIQQTAQAAGDEVVATLGREDLGQLASMGAADVVIDFSRPETLDAVCAYVRRTRTPLLSGTTGYTPAQMAELESLGTVAPVLWSANFSLGIAVFVRALQAVTGVLRPDFDIEITETHHNQKADAPSGTAKLLLEALDPAHTLKPVYGREGNCGRRDPREVGIHALRGGTVAGTHTVHFFGPDEEFEITARFSSMVRCTWRGCCRASLPAYMICRKSSLESKENDMNAQEIIDFIANAEKKTPVKVYVNTTDTVDFGSAQVFGSDYGADRKGGSYVVFGDWKELGPILEANAGKIADYVVENDCRNSAVPLLDLKGVNARIEPGAIIRDKVEIGDGAVIMMGAILNIGAVVGKGTMIDMGTVLGGRATVGDRCHIGAGTVLAGVVEPASATPVIVEDDVVIGANAVVIEGIRIGKGAVVAAGAVVIEDIPAGAVVAGSPARVVKQKDAKTEGKTALVDALRQL